MQVIAFRRGHWRGRNELKIAEIDMLMFVRGFSHNRAGNSHFLTYDWRLRHKKCDMSHFGGHLPRIQKVKCRTSGAERNSAGSGRAPVVFRIRREPLPLAFGENLR
jgi:hypothetical protein